MSDYKEKFLRDLIMLGSRFSRIVDSSSAGLAANLKATIESSDERMLRHNGVITTFAQAFAFWTRSEIRTHPASFAAELEEVIASHLAEGEERLLCTHELSDSDWSNLLSAAGKLYSQHP